MLLISINTQGLHSTARRMTAFNFFKPLQCDVIFLQETHGMNGTGTLSLTMALQIPVVSLFYSTRN